MTHQLGDEEENAFEEQLKKKGFKIGGTLWNLRGSKSTVLKGIETDKELLEIAKKIMTD